MKKQKIRELEYDITIEQSVFKTFKNVEDVFNYLKEEEEWFYKIYELGDNQLGDTLFVNKMKIKIISPSRGQQLFNEEETKTLVELYNGLQEKGIDLNFALISEYVEVGIEKAIEASRKLNDWVREIKSARRNGKELSPYEKYLYAYDIVTKFSYNEEEKDQNHDMSRHLITVLTGDKIVCAGYANLLSEICNQLGITCCTQGVNKNHAICYVRIDDDKWDIHGIYASDPTADSQNPIIDGKINERPQGFTNATIKHEDYLKTNTLTTWGLIGKVDDYTKSSLKGLIKFFTEQDKEKKQQAVEELLHNPTDIKQDTNLRAYIATLISKNLSEKEQLEILKSKSGFAGTNTIYSTDNGVTV